MRLNLGCGEDYREGWVNADVDPQVRVDVRLDLEEAPWPWGDGAATEVVMDNVLEHIDPRMRPDVLEECLRVLDPESGTLEVALPVPGAGGGWDVTHYAVPSWRWPLHPRWRDLFDVEAVSASRVGPGRAMPSELALLAARFTGLRTVDEVTTWVTPA
jgi:predicted SAM-dependent methyltransferase